MTVDTITHFSFTVRSCASEQHTEEVFRGNLKRFQFRELQSATNNFSSKNILGKGGFGIVYKGCLLDGTVVAVKRLKDGNAIGGEIQFQTEVEMISLAVHRNLLRLYGFCMTTTERLLVYPYMSNGSVASRLKGTDNQVSAQSCKQSFNSNHSSHRLFTSTYFPLMSRCIRFPHSLLRNLHVSRLK